MLQKIYRLSTHLSHS